MNTSQKIRRLLQSRSIVLTLTLAFCFILGAVLYLTAQKTPRIHAAAPLDSTNSQALTGTQLAVSSVLASSDDGNVPENTVDGNLSTRWSAENSGQWIAYDFGSQQTVSSVAIGFYKGTERVQKFSIETSIDNSQWTEVYRGQSSGKTNSLQTFTFDSTSARYARVTGYENTENKWNSLTEVEWYSRTISSGEVTSHVASARSAIVTASSDDGNTPQNTLDGDLATRWSALGTDQWIAFDLGQSIELNAIQIAFYRGAERVQRFDIEVSEDNNSWKQVFSGESNGSTNAFQQFEFAAINARYIRITNRGNTENKWISLTEVKLPGENDTSHTPTIPSPAVTPSSTQRPSPIPSITSSPAPTRTASPTPRQTPFLTSSPTPRQSPVPTPFILSPSTPPPQTNSAIPAQILNLTNWKVTLPIGSGSPTEIKQPALANYRIDPWFVGLNGAVRFRSPVNGVTTSGSSYPRSELREMTNNGSSNASWSSTSGHHTMTIDQMVTSLPKVKSHMVVGQIHDSSDDVTVFRLEGTTLWITTGDSTHGYAVDTNVPLGKRFTVAFDVSGGVVHYYYNGNLVPFTLNQSFSGAYFKAGAYTQANCSNSSPCSADNYGEVYIYNLQVTHQ